ncbi:hypothetical protein NLZ15_11200 [Atlantibacter subterranea]|uniref:hypothetical protein n=1 Tax=Atlantibacter subterraneus TaxID=255519 RepID=UPI0020C1CA1C|nr:hypothetical protein [Atlantibacter subterranea]UTJ45443.1 hypothetical protein NLZ15_11200 [Atlantibacter subterranea]
MRKFFVFFVSFTLSACTLHADVTPDGNVLNDAIVGTPYASEININGGAVFSLDSNGKEKFVGDISPSDTGLILKYCNDSPAHNCVRVQGIPIKPAVVNIRVSGGVFGTNVARGGRFDKTYTITIKDSEESS